LKKTFTGPDGTTINYTYDENNRISGIAIPGQGQITYNTYQWNSPTRITLPGGSTTDYIYDPLMQVKSIVARDPGQNPLMTRAFTYSAVGSITEKVAEHGSYTYEYDDLQRLTEAINPLSDDETYTYDLLGNRLTAANVPGSWSYNANNELTGYDNVSFAYDDNGNTTRKSVGVQETNYIYDVEDRLVQVENEIGTIIATYYYDPFGRRLWKEVDSVRTYCLYSEEGLIGEYDQNGAEIKSYGYAPDSTWTTDPLFVKIAGTYYWYQNDHAGTPQKIIDTSGKVVWSAAYDSFGNIQIQTAEIVNNLRFAGQYFDAETGLYYNLNRYYDPTTGRYLRTDPFGEGLNLYAYVFNNPNSLVDPLGLCAVKKTFDPFGLM
jgi:RHS repeat-associated protein